MSRRVLIAEPDRDLCNTYERYLARQGFTVATAMSRDECVKQATMFAPDAIVCELDFPDGQLDVFDLSVAGETTGTPAVFVATRRSPEEISDRVRSLMGGCFIKPYPMAKLARLLRSVMPFRAAANCPLKKT